MLVLLELTRVQYLPGIILDRFSQSQKHNSPSPSQRRAVVSVRASTDRDSNSALFSTSRPRSLVTRPSEGLETPGV